MTPTLIGAPARPLHTLRELADWLTVNGGPMADWGKAVHASVDDAEVSEELCTHIDTKMEAAGLEVAKGEAWTDALDRLFDRYGHVRDTLSEYFDIDIADENYAPTVTKFAEDVVAAAEFFDNVTRAMVQQGAITGTENGATIVGMLRIVIGV